LNIAIVITTYQRPDGRTPFYLRRALTAITAQIHKDYQVYVIGDCYANRQEFKNITEAFSQVTAFNMDQPGERLKYPFGSRQLWCAGGVKAGQIGIDRALDDGFEYVCHHDHDDWWDPNHLTNINQAIEQKHAFFICTVSTWMKNRLPKLPIYSGDMLEFYPLPEGVINSSTCTKYSDTNIRPRDVFAETGHVYPADADLWARLAKEMKERGRKGYVVTLLTCHHDEEGFTLRYRPNKVIT
jgi:glycosyltransferase involved in cell wall biosynthesis